MIIRNATLKDLDQINEIEQTCFPPLEAATYESLKQRIQTFKTSFLVLEYEGRIIGFINGCICEAKVINDELYENVITHKETYPNQMIFGLDVLPEFQGRGYAKLLMNEMIKVSKSNHRELIALTCKDVLIPFYEQFGFVNKGLSNSNHGNVSWYDMVLKL